MPIPSDLTGKSAYEALTGTPDAYCLNIVGVIEPDGSSLQVITRGGVDDVSWRVTRVDPPPGTSVRQLERVTLYVVHVGQ